MEFAHLADGSEWNDNEDVPYASAFDDDVENPNSHYDDTEQEEPKKKPERSVSNGKKKALLGDEEVVHAKPASCCTPVVIGASTFLVLILICAAVISGFIISDEIEKANALKTPCTNKQTGDTCFMDADNGAEGICKLDDSKFINDGELICDDVTLYEEACEQKDSDDTCEVCEQKHKNSDGTCKVKDYEPGKCMYLSTVTKVLWCDIPSNAEVACLGADKKSKQSGSECELSVGENTEKGTCEVVIYSRRKQCIVPDPDEEICASMGKADTCTTSSGVKGTCEQMMDNQLKCVETPPVKVDIRIVIVVLVLSAIVLFGLTTCGICCYCKQKG